MKRDLQIYEVENKATNLGKPYIRVKTVEGWMACFDVVACELLRNSIGQNACVEVMESVGKDGRNYSNIGKCYSVGEAPVETVVPGAVGVGVPGVGDKIRVPMSMGKTIIPQLPVPVQKKEWLSQPNKNTTMYVSYCKDMFIELIKEDTDKSDEDMMSIAIRLVKQAKEAFE